MSPHSTVSLQIMYTVECFLFVLQLSAHVSPTHAMAQLMAGLRRMIDDANTAIM